MGVLRRTVSSVVLSITAFLLGCGGGNGSTVAPPTPSLSVSPQPVSVAAGGSVTFTATTNEPSLTWVLVGTSGTGTIPPTDAGSPIGQAGGDTFVYTAPATPPVYGTNDETAGTVTLRALTDTVPFAEVETTFTITAPSITTGFYTPVSTSVALGGTLGISAYAVGSINNALTLQVNGITEGSTSVGTIVAPAQGFYGNYIYTAPATMPMTGNTITLTVISQADPTKSSNLTLTLH